MLKIGYHYQGTYYGHGSGPRRLSYGSPWTGDVGGVTGAGIFEDDDCVGDVFFHVGC